jgi:hypothetical protein
MKSAIEEFASGGKEFILVKVVQMYRTSTMDFSYPAGSRSL